MLHLINFWPSNRRALCLCSSLWSRACCGRRKSSTYLTQAAAGNKPAVASSPHKFGGPRRLADVQLQHGDRAGGVRLLPECGVTVASSHSCTAVLFHIDLPAGNPLQTHAFGNQSTALSRQLVQGCTATCSFFVPPHGGRWPAVKGWGSLSLCILKMSVCA